MTEKLSGKAASDAVSGLGWRYVLGAMCTMVPVDSLAKAATAAATAVAACGDDADRHLRADIRADRVMLILRPRNEPRITPRDLELARLISAALGEAGLRTEPGIGPEAPRAVQSLELAVDAMDIAAIRPFWRAVLDYADEFGIDSPEAAIVDPLGQGPAVWFQQMDRPRPQRNRIHLDISVPHDEAERRIEAALAAGGHMVSADSAPAWWVLADAEGNEVCISTWQGRD